MSSTIDLRQDRTSGSGEAMAPGPKRLRRPGFAAPFGPPAIDQVPDRLEAPSPERRYHLGWRTFTSDLAALLAASALSWLLVAPTPWDAAVLVAWPFALASVGALDMRGIIRGTWAPRRIWSAMARVIVALAFAGLVLPAAAVGSAVCFAALLGLMTAIGRHFVVGWVAGRHRSGELMVPILVRGTQPEVLGFVDLLERDPAQPFRVALVQLTDVPPNDQLTTFDAVEVLPSTVNPIDAAARHGVQAVAFVGRQPEDSAELRRMVWRMETEGIDARMVPVVAPLAAPEVDALGATGVPTLSFRGRDLRAESGFSKVVLDKILAAAGLVVLTPLLALVALAVKLSSPGPVLFRQTRVGRARAEFTMFKFRTMVVDAEAQREHIAALNTHQGETLFKVRQDPRVTRVGRFLRRYSLDELPQLLNVVRGDMSLVGPRPPLPREVEHYHLDAHRRFQVRPGLTGLWQVSGRSDLDPQESARLDTHYVEHWSPALDVRILASTARVVLTGAGAY